MSIEAERKYEVIEALGEEDMQSVVTAAIVGHAELAVQFERVGLSDEDDSMEDAQGLRPYLMAAVEYVRKERRGE